MLTIKVSFDFHSIVSISNNVNAYSLREPESRLF